MAVPPSHPTDSTLRSYRLGTLEASKAESVAAHLKSCPACRKRAEALASVHSQATAAETPVGRGEDQAGAGAGGAATARKKTTPRASAMIPAALLDHPDYEVIRELGRGGMGVVYLAKNRLMDREEVLKVMSRDIMERPGLLERFLREIRAVAMLHHPNIVTAHSAFRLGEDIAFTMEYVDGFDLDKMVRTRGMLPVGYSAYVTYQAALGLQHAHEKKMVHRDIKPGNLMVARQGDRAVVKILDFGLAKVAREQSIDGGITHAGQMLGTPHYIAPEQTLDAQAADIRADIYSLGCTLYFLLTAGPPFPRKNLYDILQAHHSAIATPLNTIRPDVPDGLALVVGKMMAKDVEERFQTPAEVAQALAPYFKKGGESGAVLKTEPGAGVSANLANPPETLPFSAPRAGSIEAGLIDLNRPIEPSSQPIPVSPGKAWPGWLWPSVAAGVLLLAGLVAGGVIALMGPPQQPPVANVQEDYKSMLTGVNLDGWKDLLPNGSKWEPTREGSNKGVSGRGGDLKTKPAVLTSNRHDLTDFHLRATLRNSPGLVREIRLRPGKAKGSRGNPEGLRIAVAGSKVEGGDDVTLGSIARGESSFDSRSHSVQAEATAVGTGEWYTLEIRVDGNRLVTMVNTKKVAEYRSPDGPLGPFGIDLYAPGLLDVVYRSLEIAEQNGAGTGKNSLASASPPSPSSGSEPSSGSGATGATPVPPIVLDIPKKPRADTNAGAAAPSIGLDLDRQIRPEPGKRPSPDPVKTPKPPEPPPKPPVEVVDFPLSRFAPRISKRDWSSWNVGDARHISLSEAGLTIEAGPNGNHLLTKRANYARSDLRIKLAGTPGTVAYLALRAKPNPKTKGWQAISVEISASGDGIGLWSISRDLKSPKVAPTKKFSFNHMIDLEFNIDDDSTRCNLLLDKRSLNFKSFADVPGVEFMDGAIGLFVEKGKVIIESMVIDEKLVPRK
jgi:serine/threonine protein kinase